MDDTSKRIKETIESMPDHDLYSIGDAQEASDEAQKKAYTLEKEAKHGKREEKHARKEEKEDKKKSRRKSHPST